MTRVLAELLGAKQPRFSLMMQQLERAVGQPATDIRLQSEIQQRVLKKAKALGLDPYDTTGHELYQALQQRFARDEAAVRQRYGLIDDSSSREVLQAAKRFVESHAKRDNVFVLKTSVAKRLLKAVPPKKVMKQLGYRSLESMLKHEPAAQLYVAAMMCESISWRKKFYDQYNRVRPSDFESRPLEYCMPDDARWDKLAATTTEAYRHNVHVVRELGTVIVLPLSHAKPGLAITASLLLLHAVNEVVVTSSYLKMQQVKVDFGSRLAAVSAQEPMVNASLIDRPVPWRAIHNYYARYSDAYNHNIFAPHVHQVDLRWLHPEQVLAELHEPMRFWADTHFTTLLHNKQVVSLNIFDVALNFYNQLPYAKSVATTATANLWQELMIRYLHHENVERAITAELQLQPEYAEAPNPYEA